MLIPKQISNWLKEKEKLHLHLLAYLENFIERGWEIILPLDNFWIWCYFRFLYIRHKVWGLEPPKAIQNQSNLRVFALSYDRKDNEISVETKIVSLLPRYKEEKERKIKYIHVIFEMDDDRLEYMWWGCQYPYVLVWP